MLSGLKLDKKLILIKVSLKIIKNGVILVLVVAHCHSHKDQALINGVNKLL